MIRNGPTNVSSAFEMLLIDVGSEIEFVYHGVGFWARVGRGYDKGEEI